ncbi:MAG: hypothetical protein ACYC09_13025 [Bacteroidota bacterium]
MTAPQKDFWKRIAAMIGFGIFIIGIIFGAGKIVERNENISNEVSNHSSTLKTHEIRLQTIESQTAVQENEQKNLKESVQRIERNTEETNKLIREFLKGRK